MAFGSNNISIHSLFLCGIADYHHDHSVTQNHLPNMEELRHQNKVETKALKYICAKFYIEGVCT